MNKMTYAVITAMIGLSLSLSPLSASLSMASADTISPSIPTTLSASVISSSQINLNWLASTDDVAVTGYNVYRNNILFATANSNSYSDTGLTASTTYAYTVSAYDAASNTSVKSNSVSATTLIAPVTGDVTSPTMPSNLVATSSTSTQVKLTWTASTDNVGVTGYIITRSSSQFGQKAVRISGFLAVSPTNSFTDNSAKPNTTYFYKVAAFDATGNMSAFSDKAIITTAKKSEQIKKDEHKEDHEINKNDNEKGDHEMNKNKNENHKDIKSNNGNHFGQIKQENGEIAQKSNVKIKTSGLLGQMLKFTEHKEK